MADLTRRDFLKLTRTFIFWACAVLGLGALLRFLDTRTQPDAQTDFDLGPADGIVVGVRTLLPAVPAMLVHDAHGFTALSLVCTHLGCTVESKPEGFACPCHGSRFDRQGSVTRGPAVEPLKVLRTAITPDGRLHIYTD
jgi:cytochrome b6-f complex iron-sulfur subunit